MWKCKKSHSQSLWTFSKTFPASRRGLCPSEAMGEYGWKTKRIKISHEDAERRLLGQYLRAFGDKS